jgi:hypothetical protein
VAKWGDFQSLIQLSIALNIAFATLPTFMGNVLQRTVAEMDYLITRAQEAEQVKADGAEEFRRDISTAMIFLKGDYLTIQEKFQAFLYRWMREICALTAIISTFLLVISSFCYDAGVPRIVEIMCVLELLPFLVGMSYALYLSVVPLTRLDKRKRGLITQLVDMQRQNRTARPT